MESITNTISSINPFKTEKTPMEKIKDNVSNTISSVVSPIEKTNTQKVMDKFSLTPPSISQLTETVAPTPTIGWGVRFILLFIILALLTVNSYKYLAKGEYTLLRNFFDIIENILETIKQFLENTFEGTRFGSNIVITSLKDSVNLLKSSIISLKSNNNTYLKQKESTEKAKESSKKAKESRAPRAPKGVIGKSPLTVNKNKNPKNDNSDSKIQKKTGGYCYIGYQTPHNACIKLDDINKCMSGKTFKTKTGCDEYIPN
jgi:hypothetical protein